MPTKCAISSRRSILQSHPLRTTLPLASTTTSSLSQSPNSPPLPNPSSYSPLTSSTSSFQPPLHHPFLSSYSNTLPSHFTSPQFVRDINNNIEHPMDITTEAIRNAAHEASIIDGVFPSLSSYTSIPGPDQETSNEIGHPNQQQRQQLQQLQQQHHQQQQHHHQQQQQNLRRGKWSPEEEAYVNRLIDEFRAGTLPIPNGITLRTFLSKLLNCDPMRISKKFVGNNSIGKQIYRRMVYILDEGQVRKTREELAELERNFRHRIDHPTNESTQRSWNQVSQVTQFHQQQQQQQQDQVTYLNGSDYQPNISYPTNPLQHYHDRDTSSSPYSSNIHYFHSPNGPPTISPEGVDHSSSSNQISYATMSHGEDIDWYRVFEEMKSVQKKNTIASSPSVPTTSTPASALGSGSASASPSIAFPFSIVPLDSLSTQNISSTPNSSPQSTTSSSVDLHQSTEMRSTGPEPPPLIHLNPVKTFLSSAIEPNHKKRKYLIPDDPLLVEISTTAATDDGNGTSHVNTDADMRDPLEEYVTAYVNSKPFGM